MASIDSKLNNEGNEDDDQLELPTAELRNAAYKLFGETKETRREKLAELRERIQSSSNIGIMDLSGKNLIRFLRGRKFDVTKALKAVVNMTQFFRDHPDWTTDIDNEDFSMFQTWIQLLEKRDKENRLIMVLRLGHGIHTADMDILKNKQPLKLVRWNVWFLNRLTHNLDAQVYGITLVNAFGGITNDDVVKLKSVMSITERIAVFQFISSCCPFRLKGAYIFDEPVLFRWLWNIVYYFLSQKLRERVHICGSSYDAIKDNVDDTSILPSCIGGGMEDDSYDWSASFERFKSELF